ncbi:uncharacterized protein LOC115743129 isoform X2 [Rhodamnia argentea]|uniref:Uncharacterized protein LOC115743129 isoform X2 n=1 Tax=Rhodamnia argentea TaxID=178133 RepID=A0ABM3H7K8_9MYRT|nr:uncharacterized protein LOC115743129 isoform X2 [Rhodamnia argentea]
MESIGHFSHPHLLTRCLIKDKEEVKCFACTKCCSNQYYSCDECRFFLHEECTKLPMEIKKHPLHTDHTLILGPTAYYIGIVYCDACDNRCRGFTFRCEECDFDLDIDCALKLISPRVGGVPLLVKHFSHDHDLVLTEEIDKDESARCEGCDRRCLSDTYTCNLCKFFLHKSCAELNMELQHRLHEAHSLKLRTSSSVYDGRAWCDSCGKRVRGFVYHCEICQFDLDIVCSLQSAPTSEPGDQEQERDQEQEKDHFSHEHPLIIGEEEERDVVLICAACGGYCSSSRIYGCEECEYFLHESCANLPPTMEHLYHAEHPLKLQVATYNYCDFCENPIEGFTYRCDQCDFDLDIGCAWMPSIEPGTTKKDEEVKIQFFGHDHQLTRSIKKEEEDVACSACEKQCSGLIYACDDCGFFLHKGCAKLPQECQHFFHPLHKLTLQRCDSEVSCNACEKKCRGFTFSCRECKFHLDVDCAMRVEKIHHFGHRHSLKPTKLESNSKCSACDRSLSESSLIYGCPDCKYFLHESCAKLPLEKKHQDHQSHPLKLQVASCNYCDFCGEKIEGFVYRCDRCNFNLDMKCVEMFSISSEMTKKVEEMKIKSFAHPHELTGSMQSKVDKVVCSGCNKKCTGLTYACGCKGCSFYLHKGCAELPGEYAHFFHPSHRLHLQNSDSKLICGACQANFHGFTFSCKECNFHLDVVCAMMAEKPNHGDYIQHLSHGHPLKLTKKEFKGRCLACNQSRSDSDSDLGKIYGCDSCSVWLHFSCTELPQKLEHFLHDFRKRDHERDCEITLEARIASIGGQGKLECAACQSACRGFFIYQCKLCDLNLDVECALMPSRIQEGTLTKKFPAGHGHPLQLCSIKEDTNAPSCSVCSKRCTDPTYRCIKCETFTVHESCAELPRSIQKRSRHYHQMFLRKKIRFTCAVCLDISYGFTYDCNMCSPSFSLHIGCMNLKPIIQCGDLSHYLHFLDNIHEDDPCRTCHRVIFSCSSKEMEVETENKQGLFRCVICKYSLHLLCGPLPCLIKSDNHRHVLQLKDRFVEDDSGEYYCDACEKRRDPDKCVYKCSQENCPYVAHFECMKPEVCLVPFITSIFVSLAEKVNGTLLQCQSREAWVTESDASKVFLPNYVLVLQFQCKCKM